MRIIAGTLKGRRLVTPTWAGLRPTSDKLRETLFNVLAPRIAGARVLDGFAGTGALGIEALSRGAAHVTFVEQDRRASAVIEENLRRCGIAEGYAIIRRPFDTALRALPPSSRFDVILLDPPYDLADPASAMASGGARLTATGVLVVEHATRRPPPEAAGEISRVRQIRSGDSMLSVYACVEGQRP